MSRTRRRVYRVGRVMGDVEAVASGSPRRIVRRVVNKAIGRKVVRRLWWRR